MAVADAKLELVGRGARRARAASSASGLGGLFTLEKTKETLMTKGPTKVSPYSIPGIIANLAAGQVSIALRPQGAELLHDERVLERRARHRRGERVDPPRHGATSWSPAAPRRRSRRSASPASRPCTRSRKRNDDPAHASRPFDKGRDGFVCGEGSRRPRARVAHAREEARRAHLRRGHGLRRLERRPPPHAAGAQRRGRAAVDAHGARGRAARARRDRLRQRARDVDARRRRRGVQGDRRGLRRSRDRQEALGELDEVDDGPPARRRRRGRDRGLRAHDRRRARRADDQPGRSGPASARSTTSPTRRASGAFVMR